MLRVIQYLLIPFEKEDEIIFCQFFKIRHISHFIAPEMVLWVISTLNFTIWICTVFFPIIVFLITQQNHSLFPSLTVCRIHVEKCFLILLLGTFTCYINKTARNLNLTPLQMARLNCIGHLLIMTLWWTYGSLLLAALRPSADWC